ncbi:MAG: DUF3429 domain-containing protein [Rhizobiaceae bacterium]|nr:DUF3429 domain-containing protein [Rhizobiaceae bacterium]
MAEESTTPQDETQAETQPASRKLAARLGYAGLLPAILLALWLFGIPDNHPWRPTTIALLAGYAAVVLSFLGGIRWGIALSEPDETASRAFAISVLPALGGWGALFVPPPYTFVLLAVAFAAHGAWDTLTAQRGKMPDWFARLRMQLTAGIVVTMLIAFAGTA